MRACSTPRGALTCLFRGPLATNLPFSFSSLPCSHENSVPESWPRNFLGLRSLPPPSPSLPHCSRCSVTWMTLFYRRPLPKIPNTLGVLYEQFAVARSDLRVCRTPWPCHPGSLFGPALHFQHASSAHTACVCVGNETSVFLARKTWLVFSDWQEKGKFVIFASPSTLQVLIDSPKDFYNIDVKGEHRGRQDGCQSLIGIGPRSLGRAVLGDADLALLSGPSKSTFFCAVPHFLPVVFYVLDAELPRRPQGAQECSFPSRGRLSARRRQSRGQSG